ncbi:MAG: HNH endonuclease [Bacteroidota bacterium]
MSDKTVRVVPFSDLRVLDVGHEIQLAGAVYAGKGKIYLMLYPDETLERDVEALEMTVEDWNAVIRQSDLLETEVLARAPDGVLGKAVLRKSTRQIEQNVSWRVWRRDRCSCRYCGANDVPLTVDHLVTWESGGPSIEANLVSACRKCNKTRGDLDYVAWLNHPHYQKVSRNLTQEQRDANEALAHTLDKIPRKIHISNR